jgi:hypothetical protein
MWQRAECKQMLNKIQHLELKFDVWMCTLHMFIDLLSNNDL